MKWILPVQQRSSRDLRAFRPLSWAPRTMALGLFAATLSIPTAGLYASPASPVPLFIETPSDIPAAIDQAFPSPQLSKR